MSLKQTESADEVRRTVSDDKNEGRAKTKKELMKRKVHPDIRKLTGVQGRPLSKLEQHQMQRLMSVLAHNTGNGFNREFEVGGKRGRWDDIDDERRFKGGIPM